MNKFNYGKMRRPMLIALAVCMAGWIQGCSTTDKKALENISGNQMLVLDQTVQPMDRVEVINAIKDCQVTGLRAVMIYSKKKINNQSTPIVVDVTCAPLY